MIGTDASMISNSTRSVYTLKFESADDYLIISSAKDTLDQAALIEKSRGQDYKL